jgi:hypothetical protein
MSALNEPVAKRIAKLFRLLASDFDGEVLSAARRMGQQLAAEDLSFNDIAIVIENANGEIEERKYSDADAEIIFARGVQKGREEEARHRQPDHPPEFYNADGVPAGTRSPCFAKGTISACGRRNRGLWTTWPVTRCGESRRKSRRSGC